jgi:antitoxin component YwqK of YwqJK toxin-antitoxin module
VDAKLMPKLGGSKGSKLHEHFHKDGSLWAHGEMLDGKMHGPWEFFRKDGVIMRSGAMDRGEQTGEWTTYDKAGKVYKVTKMKAPASAKKALAKKPAVAKKAPAKKK